MDYVRSNKSIQQPKWVGEKENEKAYSVTATSQQIIEAQEKQGGK